MKETSQRRPSSSIDRKLPTDVPAINTIGSRTIGRTQHHSALQTYSIIATYPKREDPTGLMAQDPNRRKRGADEAGIFDDFAAPRRPISEQGGAFVAPIDLTSGIGTPGDPIDLISPPPASAKRARKRKRGAKAPRGERLVVYPLGRKPRENVDWIRHEGIGERLQSLPQPPFWLNPAGARRVEGVVSKSAQRAWLDSYQDYTNGLGAEWVGRKILGMGSYGICGLWELPESIPLPRGRSVRKVVVKQASGAEESLEQLQMEDQWLRRFKNAGGIKHIIDTYKSIYVGPGRGIHYYMDNANKDIGRIYLEYCEGGDFVRYSKSIYSQYEADNPIPEEHIWRLFKCLVQGCVAMEHGDENEDEDPNSTWSHECVHFDIKEENVLVGPNDKEHQSTPIIKFGDFGMSLDVKGVNQDRRYLFEKRFRGTMPFLGPEQFIDHDTYTVPGKHSRRYGSSLNVWQSAKIICCVINRGRGFMGEYIAHFYAMLPPIPHAGKGAVQTMPWELVDAPYSVLLRKTVLKSLAVQIEDRPTARALLKTINVALKTFEGLAAAGVAPSNAGSSRQEPTPVIDLTTLTTIDLTNTTP